MNFWSSVPVPIVYWNTFQNWNRLKLCCFLPVKFFFFRLPLLVRVAGIGTMSEFWPLMTWQELSVLLYVHSSCTPSHEIHPNLQWWWKFIKLILPRPWKRGMTTCPPCWRRPRWGWPPSPRTNRSKSVQLQPMSLIRTSSLVLFTSPLVFILPVPRTVDPHSFFADTGPAVHLNADPDLAAL